MRDRNQPRHNTAKTDPATAFAVHRTGVRLRIKRFCYAQPRYRLPSTPTSTRMAAPRVSTFLPASARLRIRHAVLTLPALVAAAALWLFPSPFVRAAAAWWVVSDPLAPADAVLVLGGGYDRRPRAAAALYQRGLAKQVLIAQVAQPTFGASPESRRSRGALIAAGVPPAAIAPFGNNVTSTYDEARAAAKWAADHGASRLIVPTDWYHTRRVRWIFLALVPPGVRVSVMPLSDPKAPVSGDWSSLVTLARESLKYCYYRIRYRDALA